MKKGNHTGETYTMVWVDEYGEIERTAWNELPEKLKELSEKYVEGKEKPVKHSTPLEEKTWNGMRFLTDEQIEAAIKNIPAAIQSAKEEEDKGHG